MTCHILHSVSSTPFRSNITNIHNCVRSVSITLLLAFTLVISTSANSAEHLRIDPTSLKNQLAQSDLIILDTRSADDYASGHIQGALNLPVNLTYHNQSVDGRIIQPEAAQALLRKLGINDQSQIVVYDDGSLVDAARLFWTLEVYGLTKVKVLDHGFDDWLKRQYPINSEQPTLKASNYVIKVNRKRIASKFSVQIATKNPNQLVVDARPDPAYQGLVSKAKRYGHIPSAINIPASHNINYDAVASLLPVDQLKSVYKDLPKDKKIVTYCAIGRISASNYLALRELGYDVSNYDASWMEWGNDLQLPINNPNEQK